MSGPDTARKLYETATTVRREAMHRIVDLIVRNAKTLADSGRYSLDCTAEAGHVVRMGGTLTELTAKLQMLGFKVSDNTGKPFEEDGNPRRYGISWRKP